MDHDHAHHPQNPGNHPPHSHHPGSQAQPEPEQTHQHHHHPESDPHAGHTGHAMTDHSGHEELFRRKFWVSLLLSIPVLFLSDGFKTMLGIQLPTFPGSQWVVAGVSVIIFLYGGVPFLQMAVPELRNRKPGMMMLISLAITVAFVYSLASLFLPHVMDFFWELVTLIVIMLLGHWIEMRSIRQASGALNALGKLLPDHAEQILPDGALRSVPVSQLAVDDLFLVRPGSSIPADGVVVSGESSVNEAMITGESRSVDKNPGSQVIGGSINGDGSLRVRVSATGEDTALAGIMRLIEQAQQSKSPTQLLADRAAGWLFYIALGAALLTALVWTAIEGLNIRVIERVATVLVIACPHALGLAIPLVVANTTAIAARNGILIRDRLQLELARQVEVVLFDKTGTLSEGRLGIIDSRTIPDQNADEALALAAAVEGDSEHPIARAFRELAANHSLSLPKMDGFEALKGRGVAAIHENQRWLVGGPRLLEQLGAQLPASLSEFEQAASHQGQSVVHLIQSDSVGNHAQVVASYALADVLRPESHQAIEKLHAMQKKTAMLTGDSHGVAKAVAEELGITTFYAQVLPEKKDTMVSELQRQGILVAMVGDGINDAPALTRADVGIAIGGGTDVAIESAGIILVHSNPLDVVRVFNLSNLNDRKMKQNLIWAAGYNLIAIPLAAGILAPVNIVISPALGALLMSLSTIIVALNSQLMRRGSLD